MVLDLISMAFLDGGIAAVFTSPFIIPVAGCVMVACIVVSSVWAGVRSQEIRSQERLARIAQGMPVEPDFHETSARAAADALNGTAAPTGVHQAVNDGGKARRAGVVLVSVGLGLLLFFFSLAVIVQVREVMAGASAGLIPLAIGVGFLIDARLKRREFDRALEWERFRGAGADAAPGAAPGSVPPPPPAGMSAAQASDWRPLH